MMKHFRNFLAIWSGILLCGFLVLELVEAAKAVVANASDAFNIITEWYVIVIAMALSVAATIFLGIFSKKSDKE